MVLLSSISRNEFVGLINGLETMPSKTGRTNYYNIQVSGGLVTMEAKTRKHIVKIKLDELYRAYKQMDFINTTEIQAFISNWTYSPACALLIAMKLYDVYGKRISL